MPLVLAAPVAPPTPATDGAPRKMTWTGHDGSVWDLAKTTGVMTMSAGVQGLHMPPFDVFESSTPLVPGSDILGYALTGRPVYWPMNFYAESVDDWHERYGQFFDSLHPVQTGLWTVGDGDTARSLPLTYRDNGSHTFRNDPFVTGWALIGIELYAPRPLWRGKAIRQTFFAEEPVDFIPAEDGDDYCPSPVASFATATIANPGNEPAYLTWTVDGPQSELQLGVEGAIIDVPFEVPDGSQLVIDTDPAGQYATLDGVDVTTNLGFQMFGPVPARGTSALTIQSAGTGSVAAELVPLYWRAF